MQDGTDIHAFRLMPGDDLRVSLLDYCAKNKIEAAVVLSCVGSFSKAMIRFAGKEKATLLQGPLEIVVATGTASLHGLHIHLAVSDRNGKISGGHLSVGCLIHTTCEIVLQEIRGRVFKRETDEQTGYLELKIETA